MVPCEVPPRDEGVRLQRFIDITNFAPARFNALSLSARTFLINAEYLFFFFSLPSCISQFVLHVINRIILFVRLVIHPQNPLKVFCSIDLNVIPNISHPCRDSSRRAALAESLVRQKRALKFALIRGQRELVLKLPGKEPCVI